MAEPASRRSPISPRLLLLAGVVLLGGWLAVKGLRVAAAARSLAAAEAELGQLQEGGMSAIDPAAVDDLLRGVRRDVLVLRDESEIFWPLLPALHGLPRVGPLLAETPALLELADAGTAAAVYGWEALRPAFAAAGDDGLLTRLLAAAAGAGPDLAEAAREIDRAAAALAAIEEPEGLPWRVRQLLEPLAVYLPIAQDGLALAPVLDRLLGLDGQRTYLLIAQNEDELRPTGGFISGVALLQIRGGQLGEIAFDDANLVDDWANKPYDFPPDVGATALYDLMGSELFLFRDANYWPDFPTSAQAMMELYRYGRGDIPLDGVIAIDQRFLQLIVAAVGPLRVEELGVSVTGANVLDAIRNAWDPEDISGSLRDWMLSRKSFMGPLAGAIVARLNSPDVAPRLPAVALAAAEAAETRHLQIYAVDPAVASVLAQLGWDGHLPATAGTDRLLVADMNVGFNKANAAVTTALDYTVDLADDGRGEAALVVRYGHRGNRSGAPCVHRTDYTAETRYAQLVDDCYWDYSRVYVPAGARLLSGTAAPVAAETFVSGRGWPGAVQTLPTTGVHTVFANFLLLPPGETAALAYRYALPEVAPADAEGRRTYRLEVTKQAGTGPQVFTLNVNPPSGWRVEATHPAMQALDNGQLVYVGALETNLSFTIALRGPTATAQGDE